MSDTPGWVSPSSSGPAPEDSRPPAATPPGVDGPPGVEQAPGAGSAEPSDRAVQPTDSVSAGTPPPYTGAPYGGLQAPPPAQQGWGAPQQGWGQQPGWGQPGWAAQPGSPFSGWGAPPSPKPGVIPLRPLGVGEILDGAISTTRKYWRTVLGLSLVVSVLVNTTTNAATWWMQNDTHNVAALVTLALTLVLDMLAGLVLTALLTMVVSKAILGEPVSFTTAWRAARPQIWRLLGLTLLVGLIITGIMAVGLIPMIVLALSTDASPASFLVGFPIFLVALVLAAWMWIRLSLAAPALMLEKQGVGEAMSRSRRLVRGSWWRIFGVTLLGSLLAFMLSAMIAVPFSLLAQAVTGSASQSPFAAAATHHPQPLAAVAITTIAAILGSLLSYPIQAGINVLLYVDQRIRREALDLELARAAGLPEYGGTGWAGQPAPPAGV